MGSSAGHSWGERLGIIFLFRTSGVCLPGLLNFRRSPPPLRGLGFQHATGKGDPRLPCRAVRSRNGSGLHKDYTIFRNASIPNGNRTNVLFSPLILSLQQRRLSYTRLKLKIQKDFGLLQRHQRNCQQKAERQGPPHRGLPQEPLRHIRFNGC